MMVVADIFHKYNALLFTKAKAGALVIVSVFLCGGLFLSLSSAFFLKEYLVPSAFSLSLAAKLLLVYFSITLLFAVGLSQAGFAVIPLLSLLMGITVSFLLYTGNNGDSLQFIFGDLPYGALLMLSTVIYGAFQLKTSWRFFAGVDSAEVLDVLQLNIKLYYFTLAVFALLTCVISGLGYIIPFVYRSLF